MAGLIFLSILAMFVVGSIIFIKIDNARGKPDPTKSIEYRQLRETLLNIRQIASDQRDTDPIFADVILDEINKHERKELNG